jgi:hypothetical protein
MLFLISMGVQVDGRYAHPIEAQGYVSSDSGPLTWPRDVPPFKEIIVAGANGTQDIRYVREQCIVIIITTCK